MQKQKDRLKKSLLVYYIWLLMFPHDSRIFCTVRCVSSTRWAVTSAGLIFFSSILFPRYIFAISYPYWPWHGALDNTQIWHTLLIDQNSQLTDENIFEYFYILIWVLSFVRSHTRALIYLFSSVLSYTCFPMSARMSFQMCAVEFSLPHIFSYFFFHICPLKYVLSDLYSHVCNLLCVLSSVPLYVCSPLRAFPLCS